MPVPPLHLDPTLSTMGPKSSVAFQHLGKLHREVWTSLFVLERGWIRWEKRDRHRGSQSTSEISRGRCWGQQLIIPTAAGTLREGGAHSLKAAMLRTQAPRQGLSGVHRGPVGQACSWEENTSWKKMFLEGYFGWGCIWGRCVMWGDLGSPEEVRQGGLLRTGHR